MPVPRSYTTAVTSDDRGRVIVPVPFDPDEGWGVKPRHHLHGKLNGMGVRPIVDRVGGGVGCVLGAAGRRDCGVSPGDAVEVVLAPEGPQREDLADDVRAALDAD